MSKLALVRDVFDVDSGSSSFEGAQNVELSRKVRCHSVFGRPQILLDSAGQLEMPCVGRQTIAGVRNDAGWRTDAGGWTDAD